MKFAKLLIVFSLIISVISCHNDESIIGNEQISKTYELIEIKWRLGDGDGQSIVEDKIPEFYFINDTNVDKHVVVNPLENKMGSSKFTFNDSLMFQNLDYKEIQVSIPNELSLLSGTYVNISGGVQVLLGAKVGSFPFSQTFEDSITLIPNTSLTSNYTLFIKRNKASFNTIFKETTTGELIMLEGSWEGEFFNNLEGQSVINETN